jgi:hypothetical protein
MAEQPVDFSTGELETVEDARHVPFSLSAATVGLYAWQSRPIEIMLPYTSSEGGGHGAHMFKRIKPYGTLISGDAPCPSLG